MIFAVENGSFAYSGGRTIFQNVNFSVKKGEMLAILGPNGAGKTTLLRCMMGFLKWKSGRSTLDGQDIASLSQRQLFSHIAYVPQSKNAALSQTVADMVLLGRSAHYGIFGKPGAKDRAIVADILQRLGLTGLSQCSCARLSGGELQMVLVARALAAEPEIIILDEPESNLDFKNQLVVLQTLHQLTEQGISCIFNTHYPVHALRHADRALLLDRTGRIVWGTPQSVITTDNMRRAFGVETVIGELETDHNCYPDVLAVATVENENYESENLPMNSVIEDNTRLAIMGIIVEDRECAEKINGLLHEYGEYVVSRSGMPYPKRGVHIITVIIDAPESAISNLSGKLGQLKGVSVKVTYSKR